MKRSSGILFSLIVVFSPFLFSTKQALAQNHGITATYQGSSFEQRLAIMGAMKQAYDEMEADLNGLISYISNILSQNIDKEMRETMNREFKSATALQEKLYSSGLNGIRPAFNSMKARVQREVVEYNNRVAGSQNYSSNNKDGFIPKKNWSGSGFALNDGYITTNYHVIKGAKKIFVKGVNGLNYESYNAEVVAVDEYHDLAILRIKDPLFPGFGEIPYSIKRDPADVAEEVFVLGYPLYPEMGAEIKYTAGVISSLSGFQGDNSVYQISAPVQAGNSGSPLFDSNGNIIGIVNEKLIVGENVGYAIKVSYLDYLIKYSNLPYTIVPSSNLISNLSRSDQIKVINAFVFLIVCSDAKETTGYTFTQP